MPNRTQRHTRRMRAKGYSEEEIKEAKKTGFVLDALRASEAGKKGGPLGKPPRPSAVRGFENDR